MAEAGGSEFEARCGRCHPTAAGENDTGPSLSRVFNRPAGTVPDFRYSGSYVDAGKQGLRWDEDNLMAFLIDQPLFLTRVLKRPAMSDMDKHYSDESLRRAIVEYLKTLQ